jgi:hypothetical protein
MEKKNMLPPQKWPFAPVPCRIETCHGIGLEAVFPPTIRLEFMKFGTEAVK